MISAKREYTNKEEILNLYFNEPTQVIFYTTYSHHLKGGIAYCNEIIRGEDGAIIPIEEVDGISIYPWISINDEIIGN